MNYLKSVLTGLVAVLVICGILSILAASASIFVLALGFGVEVPHWHSPSLAGWLFLFAAFGAGFLWQLRRIAKQKLPPAPAPTDLRTS